MPFPAGVQTVTVTAPALGYRTLDGEYQQGTITLTPTVPEVVSAEHGIIAVGAVNLTIGASGSFIPRAVLPCDAENFTPTGWTYRLDQNLTGETPRSYNVLIPASATSVDLSTLIEVEASDGTAVSMPAVVSVNGRAGVVAGLLDAANNLSDLLSPSTARTNLGLSPVATLSVGTSANTVAAGDDSRIVGAAQKSANLSDLGSASAARTNLGLGGAATLSIGTTANTVAAGDDARLSNARTPTLHAASHGSAGSDPITVAQSQVTGLGTALAGKTDGPAAATDNALARFDGTSGKLLQNSTIIVSDDGAVTITGSLTEAGDLTVWNSHTAPTKGYRFRSSGGALDTEFAGNDWYWSNFPNADFSGTQRTYMRWENGAAIIHLTAELQCKADPFSGRVHTLDGAGNKAGFFGAQPVGRQTVAGSRASGAAFQSLLTALANLGFITDSTTA